MPYIEPYRRDELNCDLLDSNNVGELNYCVTKLCLDFMKKHDKIDYELLNSIVGVLESAKSEFYARAVRPYEDSKISVNGDIYGRRKAYIE